VSQGGRLVADTTFYVLPSHVGHSANTLNVLHDPLGPLQVVQPLASVCTGCKKESVPDSWSRERSPEQPSPKNCSTDTIDSRLKDRKWHGRVKSRHKRARERFNSIVVLFGDCLTVDVLERADDGRVGVWPSDCLGAGKYREVI
jgi:hypothetical protein